MPVHALTEAHRLAQLKLGAITIRQLRPVWQLLNPSDLDATFPQWVATVHPIIEANRAQSARLAAAYFTALRTLSIGSPGGVLPAGPVDPRSLLTSMLVTGPISIRANLSRIPFDKAVDIAEARTSAAAMRHVLNGGRETITATIKADRRAVGYQRVTSGDACDFCSMLADRGAVYGEDSADFEAHDRCGCTAEPVFR